MRYFLMKKDERYTDVPQFRDWFQQIDVRDITPLRSHKLAYRTLLQIVPYEHNTYPDILFSPALLFSQKMRDIVALYEKRITYKQIVLLDSENMVTELYFMPILSIVDCLTEESEYNLDHSVVTKAVLDQAKIPGKSLFWLDNVKSKHTIIRLDLAESILRRQVEGLVLIDVELKRGG